MLCALRRCRSSFWLAIVALLFSAPASIPAWHDPGDDPLCNPAIVVHDHAAHQIGAATAAPTDAGHCAICHWLETLRGATPAAGLIVQHGVSALLVAPSSVITLTRILEGRSGRAPPLS